MNYVTWLRSRLGSRKILLAYATVILQDADGRVLIQRRSDFAAYGLPGGVMELGETILDCARRELREETGLEAGALALTGLYSEPALDILYPNGDEVQQFTVCFHAQLTAGHMRQDGSEVKQQQFLARVDIPWEELLPWYRVMLSDLFAGQTPAYAPPITQGILEEQIPILRASVGPVAVIGVGSVGAVVDEQGRLLVIRRRDDGNWTLPGGFSNLGENAAHTAVRETREETGLETYPDRLLGIFSPAQPWQYPNGDITQTVGAIYKLRVLGGELSPATGETLAARWATPEELLTLEAHPLTRRLHQTVVANLEKGNFILT